MTEWTDGATISQWSGLMKLRACDCGATDSGWVDARGDDSSDYAAWVVCRECGRAGPECVESTKEQAIAAAIAGWNHRPAEDALRAENERLEAEVKQLKERLSWAEIYFKGTQAARCWGQRHE